MLRGQAPQDISGRRGSHGDQRLSEPPPLLDRARESLLEDLQRDEMCFDEDPAQRLWHDARLFQKGGRIMFPRRYIVNS